MFGPRQGARQWKQEAASRPALPLECCLAKTRRLPDGSAEGHTVEGRTVMDHSRIAGAVADVLLARLPDTVRALFPANAAVLCCMMWGKSVPRSKKNCIAQWESRRTGRNCSELTLNLKKDGAATRR